MIGKMNLFQRFWYTIFELISNKSNFRDMPYGGTALVLYILTEILIATVIGYWKCFSTMYGELSIDMSYSRIVWTVLLCVPFPVFYFYNKKIGLQIVERFKKETEDMKKKRRQETGVIITLSLLFLIGLLIWRLCQTASH